MHKDKNYAREVWEMENKIKEILTDNKFVIKITRKMKFQTNCIV